MKKLLGVAMLLLAGSAFAGELAKPGEKVSPAAKKREVAPLLYVLPSLGTSERAVMEIRILQGKRLLVSEVVALPAGTAEGAAVDVLFTHPSEITRLRAIEAETPGSLRFLSFIEGRVITDEPFAAVEARGAKASLAAAVGEIYEVEVKPAPRLRVQANTYDEDPCWQDCNSKHDQCLDWCDPRSDECSRCETWYHDCIQFCPVPCSEPKSVSTYSNYTVYSSYFTGQIRCVAGERWDLLTVRYLVTDYQRTEHCDGSHTDVFVGSHYEDHSCWANTHYFCYPSDPYFIYPQC